MKRIKKFTAIMLSLVMIVCMFSIPAEGESTEKPYIVNLYIDEKSDKINLYLDGIDDDYLKNMDRFLQYNQKAIINKYNYNYDGFCIVLNHLSDSYLWFTVSKDSADTIQWEGGMTFDNYDYKMINIDVKYYSKNNSVLTNGYCITIKDRTTKEILLNSKYLNIDFEVRNGDQPLNPPFITHLTNSDEDPRFILNLLPSAPAKTTLSASAKKNKLTLTWDKVSDAEKYQVYVSTDGGKTYSRYKTYKATATKATYTLKKGNTYKFKVRSYKTVNGKKVYSKWSNVKTVKY